jgi:TRAP-type mannitol/chloroaromatic compound transport system substrate-binding protein
MMVVVKFYVWFREEIGIDNINPVYVVLAYWEAMVYFLTLDTLFDHNQHNMLLNFLRCLVLQTSKTDNSALDIDAIYNLKLRKT